MEFRDPMKVERRVQPSPEPTDETHGLSGVEAEHCCRNINKYMHTLRYLIIRAISCPMPGLPSSTPVLGDKSLLELVVATATIILGVLLAGSSQHKADYICALCILLCTRYNVLACVFKISRERGMLNCPKHARYLMQLYTMHSVILAQNYRYNGHHINRIQCQRPGICPDRPRYPGLHVHRRRRISYQKYLL